MCGGGDDYEARAARPSSGGERYSSEARRRVPNKCVSCCDSFQLYCALNLAKFSMLNSVIVAYPIHPCTTVVVSQIWTASAEMMVVASVHGRLERRTRLSLSEGIVCWRTTIFDMQTFAYAGSRRILSSHKSRN
jgi:hypothetical protein